MSQFVPHECVFCELPQARVIDQNLSAVVIRDAYPVSEGHTLVIPRRHVASFFDLSELERSAVIALLDSAKLALDHEFSPQGYNVGINDGVVAGQTVPHVHVHLIPRYAGDAKDPRGGIRWVLPSKARYWP